MLSGDVANGAVSRERTGSLVALGPQGPSSWNCGAGGHIWNVTWPGARSYLCPYTTSLLCLKDSNHVGGAWNSNGNWFHLVQARVPLLLSLCQTIFIVLPLLWGVSPSISKIIFFGTHCWLIWWFVGTPFYIYLHMYYLVREGPGTLIVVVNSILVGIYNANVLGFRCRPGFNMKSISVCMWGSWTHVRSCQQDRHPWPEDCIAAMTEITSNWSLHSFSLIVAFFIYLYMIL